MTSDVTLTSVATDASQTQQQSVQLAEDFDDFLTLLTTQLQNQDPLDPADSTEFTNQIVQFSQVEQQINMNQKLDDLLSLELAGISSIALGYVGLDVSYLSAELNFDGSTPVQISYSLSEAASDARMNIFDEAGELVYSQPAPKDTGANSLTWDGTNDGGAVLPEGTYTVSIDALNLEQNPIDTTTVVTGRVRGIESQNGIVFTLIGDRAVPLSSIINASLPEETTASSETDGGSDETSTENTEQGNSNV